MFERPSGIRASLERTFANVITEERCSKPPLQRGRLQFGLAVLHAVVVERTVYAPVGWSKPYEFGDADLMTAMEILDTWVDSITSLGNMKVAEIPWVAMGNSIYNVAYGGRVDNVYDSMLLKTFVDHIFRAESLADDFQMNLFEGEDPDKFYVLTPPRSKEWSGFKEW